MIIIDGDSFNVEVLGIEESADFLDKFAQRAGNGKLRRELIGTYQNYQLRFASPITTAERLEAARLWTKLKEAVPFHEVTVPDEDGVNYTFTAYFSNVKRTLRRLTPTKTFWKTMTVNYIAQEPSESA